MVSVNKRTVAVVVGGLCMLVVLTLMWGTSAPAVDQEEVRVEPVRSAATPTAALRLPVGYADADPRDFGPLSYASLVPTPAVPAAEADPAERPPSPDAAASAFPVAETAGLPAAAAPEAAPAGPSAADVAELLARVEAIQLANEAANVTAYRSGVFFAAPVPATAETEADLFGVGLDSPGGGLGGIVPPLSPLVAERTATVDTNLQLEKRAFADGGSGGVRPGVA